MGMYDQNARRAAMMEPTFLLVRLRKQLGMELTWRRPFDSRSVPLPSGPDREADMIAVCDEVGGEKRVCLLIHEFQSEHDESKLKTLQLEATICLCHAKDTDHDGGELLPLGVFVYLKGHCPQNELNKTTRTGIGLRCKVALWEICKDSAAATLKKCAAKELPWGAMFWVSLMKGGDKKKVISDWITLRDLIVPEGHRADVTYTALELAELVGRRLAWERVLKGVNVPMSQLGLEMVQLGEQRAMRHALTEVIQLRFPEVLTPDVEQAIADLSTLAILKEWHTAAVASKTANDFLRVLKR